MALSVILQTVSCQNPCGTHQNVENLTRYRAHFEEAYTLECPYEAISEVNTVDWYKETCEENDKMADGYPYTYWTPIARYTVPDAVEMSRAYRLRGIMMSTTDGSLLFPQLAPTDEGLYICSMNDHFHELYLTLYDPHLRSCSDNPALIKNNERGFSRKNDGMGDAGSVPEISDDNPVNTSNPDIIIANPDTEIGGEDPDLAINTTTIGTCNPDKCGLNEYLFIIVPTCLAMMIIWAGITAIVWTKLRGKRGVPVAGKDPETSRKAVYEELATRVLTPREYQNLELPEAGTHEDTDDYLEPTYRGPGVYEEMCMAPAVTAVYEEVTQHPGDRNCEPQYLEMTPLGPGNASDTSSTHEYVYE